MTNDQQASAHEPPATVTLLHCAECGMNHADSKPWIAAHGRPMHKRPLCPGTVQTLAYELRVEPQRTREEMIEAGRVAVMSIRDARGWYSESQELAEAVLIAAGVIEAAPDA